MTDSTKTKAKKPYPDYPLTPHPRGYWVKKIKGRTHYFGPIENPQAALEKWLAEKDYLLAELEPPRGDGLTFNEGAQLYVDRVENLVESGELSERWIDDLVSTVRQASDVIGTKPIDELGRDDFKALRRAFNTTRSGRQVSPVTLKKQVDRIRGLFSWLQKAGHIDATPGLRAGFRSADRRCAGSPRKRETRQAFDAATGAGIVARINGIEPAAVRRDSVGDQHGVPEYRLRAAGAAAPGSRWRLVQAAENQTRNQAAG